MKKVTNLVLMLCLSLSAAFCYAHGVARTENEKGKVRKALRYQPQTGHSNVYWGCPNPIIA